MSDTSNDPATNPAYDPAGGERLVILLRHGEAAPAGAGGDRERPLAPGAAEAVRETARRIAAHRPTVALVSPARRTVETFTACAGFLPDVEERREPAIYEASADALAGLLDAAGPGPVLLVGHNPGLSALAQAWSGGAFADVMRPADAVALAVDGAGRGRLVEHVRPDVGRVRGD